MDATSKNIAEGILKIGADGHERSECEPDRAKRSIVVKHILTTPSARLSGFAAFLDRAATPPLEAHLSKLDVEGP